MFNNTTKTNRTKSVIYDPLCKQISFILDNEKSSMVDDSENNTGSIRSSIHTNLFTNSFDNAKSSTEEEYHFNSEANSISQEELMVYCPPNEKCLETYNFPRISVLVLSYLFLSKLSFISIQTLFSIYLLNHLKYSKTITTIFYHTMSATSSFCTIFAATLADNYFGRLKTMIIFGTISGIGNLLIPVSVSMNNLVIPLIVGFMMLAIGEGGLRACLSAFGADQLSEVWHNEITNKKEYFDGNQQKIENYFSLIYFIVNIAGLCGNFLLPIIKNQVFCTSDIFNMNVGTTAKDVDECYPLALLITFLSYLFGFIIFLVGFKFYVRRMHIHNLSKKLFSCILAAFRNRRKYMDKKTKIKFLDYASFNKEYSMEFVEDIRKAMQVAVVFLPFPIFWALYEQEASKWLFQANQMDGRVKPDYSWIIQPEQMLAINLLCCVIAIPFKNAVLNPIFIKLNILNRSTSKMVFGYLLAAVSFLMAGSLQYYIDKSLLKDMPINGESQLYCFTRIHQRNFYLTTQTNENFYKINPAKEVTLNFEDITSLTVNVSLHDIKALNSTKIVKLLENHRTYMLFEEKDDSVGTTEFLINSTDVLKSFPIIKIISRDFSRENFTLFNKKTLHRHSLTIDQDLIQIEPGIYVLTMNDGSQREYSLDRGSISVMDMNFPENGLFRVFQSKTITIWAQLPQIIVLTFAELFLCISALDFAYFEAPESMRTLMQALNYTTMFMGNILVILFSFIYETFEFLSRFGYDYFIESVIAFIGTIVLKIIIDWYDRKSLIMKLSEAGLTNEDSSTKNVSHDSDPLRKISSFISVGSQFSTTSRRSVINWSSSLISNEINQTSMTSVKFDKLNM